MSITTTTTTEINYKLPSWIMVKTIIKMIIMLNCNIKNQQKHIHVNVYIIIDDSVESGITDLNNFQWKIHCFKLTQKTSVDEDWQDGFNKRLSFINTHIIIVPKQVNEGIQYRRGGCWYCSRCRGDTAVGTRKSCNSTVWASSVLPQEFQKGHMDEIMMRVTDNGEYYIMSTLRVTWSQFDKLCYETT